MDRISRICTAPRSARITFALKEKFTLYSTERNSRERESGILRARRPQNQTPAGRRFHRSARRKLKWIPRSSRFINAVIWTKLSALSRALRLWRITAPSGPVLNNKILRGNPCPRFSRHGLLVTAEKNQKLIVFLRDNAPAHQRKNGCRRRCGTCMCSSTASPRKPASSKTDRLEGKSILTVEGLTRVSEMFTRTRLLSCGAVSVRFLHTGHGDQRKRPVGRQ